MLYQRSLEIEQRLDGSALPDSRRRTFDAQLSSRTQTRIPTISRCVAALRERGHDIRAEKHDGGWRYVVHGSRANRKLNG